MSLCQTWAMPVSSLIHTSNIYYSCNHWKILVDIPMVRILDEKCFALCRKLINFSWKELLLNHFVLWIVFSLMFGKKLLVNKRFFILICTHYSIKKRKQIYFNMKKQKLNIVCEIVSSFYISINMMNVELVFAMFVYSKTYFSSTIYKN